MAIRQIKAKTFSDYLICPSLYYYKNLENFSEILFGQNEGSKNGEIIHQIIDAHFKGLPVPLLYIETNPGIKLWWDYYLAKYQTADKNETYSEWNFNIPIGTPLEKVILSGRIDRFSWETDRIIIYDWKSAAKKDKFNDLINRIQMEFYAYALYKINGIEKFEIKIVYLELREETTIILDKKDLQAIEEKLLNMIKKTHSDIKTYIPVPIFIEKNLPACTVCHFFRLCRDLL